MNRLILFPTSGDTAKTTGRRNKQPDRGGRKKQLSRKPTKSSSNTFVKVALILLGISICVGVVIAVVLSIGGGDVCSAQGIDDPLTKQMCKQGNCLFDVSICSEQCPFGYDEGKDGCPHSCMCAAGSSSFEGDLHFSQDELPTMLSKYGFLNEEEGFSLFKSSATLLKSTQYWNDNISGGRIKIAYKFDDEYPPTQVKVTKGGFKLLKDSTCIDFISRTSEKYFILFKKDVGCWSDVGKAYYQPEGQTISIGTGCELDAIVAHEIIHALGFLHEQSRPDRDDFVKINYDNMQGNRKHNFKKLPADKVKDLGTDFDYGSVMLYGGFSFSSNNKPTITQIKDDKPTLGQRKKLSKIDIEDINKLYCEKLEGSGGSGSSTRPGGSTVRPVGSTVRPGGNYVRPGGSSVRPGGNYVRPGGSYVRPGGSSVRPGGNYVRPGGSSVRPGGSYVRPGGNYVRPGGSSVRPGGSYVRPGGSSVRPGGNYVRPGGSSVRPGGNYVRPGGNYVRPGGNYVRPGGSSVRPGGSANVRWGQWGEWAGCPQTCGGSGTASRKRTCTGGTVEQCKEKFRSPNGDTARRICRLNSCPHKGAGWGEWGEYRRCSHACGRGFQYRIRRCGSVGCPGRWADVRVCNTQRCGEASRGSWGAWADVGCTCIVSVGRYDKKKSGYRRRKCLTKEGKQARCYGRSLSRCLPCTSQSSPKYRDDIQDNQLFSRSGFKVPDVLCTKSSTIEWVFGDFNGDDKVDAMCGEEGGIFKLGLSAQSGSIDQVDWEGRLQDCERGFKYSADFNGDGLDDLLCQDKSNRLLSLRLSDKGGFSSTAVFEGRFCTDSHDKILVLDSNGDGRADVLCGRDTSGYEIMFSS